MFTGFKPTNVFDYPAFITSGKQKISDGTCTVDVGVKNDVVLYAAVQFSSVDNPCEGAKAVAEAAITTMKKGS